MQTSPFDFVSALSAEELCPVCKELHAAVDECLCVMCQTHVCRDCSSLQPDTSWICGPCDALIPARAYPLVPLASARPTIERFHQLRHASREQLTTWLHGVGPALARMQSGSRALLAIVRSALIAVLVASRPRLLQLRTQWVATRQNARAQSLVLAARTRLAARQARVHAGSAWVTLRQQCRTSAAQLRRASIWTVQTVRELPLRQHATSIVVATIILIAVARAEKPDAS